MILMDKCLSWLLKFTDDTKVFSKIITDFYREQLQNNFNKLEEWAERWQMTLNSKV